MYSRHRKLGLFLVLAVSFVLFFETIASGADWVVYEGQDGPGKGKHIVFVASEWEYRSEEGFPMLAKILAVRHGFKCTVLFPVDPEDGTINPNCKWNIPGLENLATADMMVFFAMDLVLPDEQMKHIVDFANSGKPILGLRCSVLAFKYGKNKQSPYAKYGLESEQGGFGKIVLGETWRGHHGEHKVESARGLINGRFRQHPILRGVQDIWGPTDVYLINELPKDAEVLVYGMVLKGMKPDDPPNLTKPIMPLVWTRQYVGDTGKKSKIVCSTIASAIDFESEDLRRLLINSIYWGLDMEQQIQEKSNVEYVGEYQPSFFGADMFKKGLKPDDYRLKKEACK